MDNQKSNIQELIGSGYILGATMMWGSTFLFQKILLENNIQPFMMIGLRFSFALLILLKVKFHTLSKETLKKGLILGITLFSAFSLQTLGIQYIDVSISAFLTGMTVIFVPILNYFLFKTKLTWINVLITVMALFGVYIFNITPDSQLDLNIGFALTLLCAVCFGLHVIFSSKFLENENPWVLNGLQSIVCSILGFIFSFSFGEGLPTNWNIQSIIGILYLGLIGSLACYTLQAMGQKLITNVVKVGLILAMEPIFATALSVMFYDEVLTLYKIIGMIIITISLVISECYGVLLKKNNEKATI